MSAHPQHPAHIIRSDAHAIEFATRLAAPGQIPQNHLGVVDILLQTATEEQKRHYVGKVLAGYRFGNAFSEAKSILASGATRAPTPCTTRHAGSIT